MITQSSATSSECSALFSACIVLPYVQCLHAICSMRAMCCWLPAMRHAFQQERCSNGRRCQVAVSSIAHCLSPVAALAGLPLFFSHIALLPAIRYAR